MKKHTIYFLILFLLTLSTFVNPQDLLASPTLKDFGGIYHDQAGKKYFLNPREGFPHFVVMSTGETHMIRQTRPDYFEFSPTRNSWESVGGSLEFKNAGGAKSICISFVGKKSFCVRQVPIRRNELSLTLGGGLTIVGDLLEPNEPKSDLVAILLHGDGKNDRYDLYDAGMYLLSEGYSVFAFDKRNAGKSNGPKVVGVDYDEISRVYANDAVKIVAKLIDAYPKKRFGVVGGSQGGWIGSIVSAKAPNLAFYVNIAGNISIGWHQWNHYMISYLKRNGFTKSDVAEAEDYFKTFFGVGLKTKSFDEYKAKLFKYQNRSWLKRLARRKTVVWKDEDTAVRYLKSNSNNPATDVEGVTAPTLGIFFEFDHSTPPDSPAIFLQSLLKSDSKDVTVRVFPDSTHGGWSVTSYFFDTSDITRMESRAYYFLADWLKSI